MQRGVDRVAREVRGTLLGIEQEGVRADGQLEHVVEQLEAGAVAQPHAQLAEAPAGQPVTAGQADVFVVECLERWSARAGGRRDSA